MKKLITGIIAFALVAVVLGTVPAYAKPPVVTCSIVADTTGLTIHGDGLGKGTVVVSTTGQATFTSKTDVVDRFFPATLATGTYTVTFAKPEPDGIIRCTASTDYVAPVTAEPGVVVISGVGSWDGTAFATGLTAGGTGDVHWTLRNTTTTSFIPSALVPGPGVFARFADGSDASACGIVATQATLENTFDATTVPPGDSVATTVGGVTMDASAPVQCEGQVFTISVTVQVI